MTAVRTRRDDESLVLDQATIERRVVNGDIVALLAELDADVYSNRDEGMALLETFVERHRGPGFFSELKRILFRR